MHHTFEALHYLPIILVTIHKNESRLSFGYLFFSPVLRRLSRTRGSTVHAGPLKLPTHGWSDNGPSQHGCTLSFIQAFSRWMTDECDCYNIHNSKCLRCDPHNALRAVVYGGRYACRCYRQRMYSTRIRYGSWQVRPGVTLGQCRLSIHYNLQLPD